MLEHPVSKYNVDAELDMYLHQTQKMQLLGLGPLKYRIRSFEYKQLDVFQVQPSIAIVPTKFLKAYPNPLPRDQREQMLDHSKQVKQI